jgi:hypothetical protein
LTNALYVQVTRNPQFERKQKTAEAENPGGEPSGKWAEISP